MRGYSSTYFDDKIPQFLMWSVRLNGQIFWRIASYIVGDAWRFVDHPELVFSTCQKEIILAGKGKVIQQIYFIFGKQGDADREYIFKENPLVPAAQLKPPS